MEEARVYIESGILELFVLGQLNAQEQAEVESMAAKYPEVKQELEAIEIAMEQYALLHAVSPSEKLGEKIMSHISLDPATRITLPVSPLASEINNQQKIRTLRFALAACIALLAISVAALFSTRNALRTAKDQIAELSVNNQKYTSTVNYMRSENEDLRKIADMKSDPDWKAVKLAGTAMDPKASMMVYWHVSGKHVMMDNSKTVLPANDNIHQYQLWALVNGKPVDLGVFDVRKDHSKILVNMKDIAGAQTFAVTLEKKGGSPTPTLDKMIVAGNVSI
ncbi:anti-sigma factor [Pedobacter sp. JY14-1]|uniref:anti-sigma factor n=1 Tax=Pedobacter sp. JY14-1 TaxID=3034151 RepID=UPI0023E33B99|nr:anti-sigma factor [Pedobacter sp. JY14-1]